MQELKEKGYYLMADGTKSTDIVNASKKKKAKSETKPGKKRASALTKGAKKQATEKKKKEVTKKTD